MIKALQWLSRVCRKAPRNLARLGLSPESHLMHYQVVCSSVSAEPCATFWIKETWAGTETPVQSLQSHPGESLFCLIFLLALSFQPRGWKSRAGWWVRPERITHRKGRLWSLHFIKKPRGWRCRPVVEPV